jgi:ankyrin repeat protein
MWYFSQLKMFSFVFLVSLIGLESYNFAAPELDVQLIQAVCDGNLEQLEVSIFQGADVNVRNNDEMTPLLIAAWRGDTNVVEKLIESRADIHATCKCGPAAIHLAAGERHINIVEILLKYAGVAINSSYKDGNTTLHLAAALGQTYLV